MYFNNNFNLCYCAGTRELTTAYGTLVGWWLTKEKVRTREVTSPSAVVSTISPQIEPRRLLWETGYWSAWGPTTVSQPNKVIGFLVRVRPLKFKIESRYAWQNTFPGTDQYTRTQTRWNMYKWQTNKGIWE
jgi:hypothetical protein